MINLNTKTADNIRPVSTASLPDIVFMLLFFFMTVTVMKDTKLKVENFLPTASEIKKMERKDRIIYIYVGRPIDKYTCLFGAEPRIQLNDKYANIEDVGPYVREEMSKRPEHLRKSITIALKIDRNADMGLISDIKRELRQVNALKINYSSYNSEAFKMLD